MQEEWKIIEKAPKYEISNLGNVRSNASIIPVIRKHQIDNNGYPIIALYYADGDILKQYRVRIHRLVAETFIPNANNLIDVNHKDGNKKNNNFENLEWVNRTRNMQHAYDTGLLKQKKDGSQSNCKKVYQYDKEGNFIAEYPGARFAERVTGIKAIQMGCNGKRKYVGGYVWKYQKN